jgi:hypothetical protein
LTVDLTFHAGSKLSVHLKGTTDYTQVIATGPVNLTGSSLNLFLDNGFNPANGTTFDILVNHGGSAITGTFSQGSTITVGGQTFSISYTGPASGNDIVLTKVPTPISINSFVINGTAATNVSASSTGATVTITTATSLGFYTNELVTISGFNTVTAYNGRFTIQTITNNGLSFTYTDAPLTGTLSDIGGTATPSLIESPNGNERSKVNSIVIAFNQAVTIGGGGNTAFSLAQRAFTKNSVPGTLQGDTTTTVNYVSYDGGFSYVLTFSGGTVVGGSISDGDYNITLNHTLVTGGGGLAADYTNNFYRLFGDINGNGQVGNAANIKFRNAFGSSSTGATAASFVPAFDYGSTGTIGNSQNIQFRNRFGSVWTNL